MRLVLDRRERLGMALVTVDVVLLNYVFYYADDLELVWRGTTDPTVTTTLFQAVSFPVWFYVEVVESRLWFFEWPVVGQAINYVIELTYFYLFTCAVYVVARWLVDHIRGPL